jgi:protein-tyrosine phosphatase
MRKRLLIDIHNHTLFGVDDGPEDIEESIEMLRDAKNQGVEAIILTPHYRHGMFPYRQITIEENFEKLKKEAELIGINIFLGCEYHIDDMASDAFLKGRCHTLADSDYVLSEYKYEVEYAYIEKQTYQLLSSGFTPIIAHAERYNCLVKKPQLCEHLSKMGALIQINADSVLGITGFAQKHCCKKLLKNQWVDIVASDAHGAKQRTSNLLRGYEYIEKKYNTEYADLLFYKNPLQILT